MLRRAIPEVAAVSGQAAVPLVLANSDTLQLNPAAAVTVDARRFAALIDRIRPGLDELEEAVDLYRGDFLADFYLPDSNPFEEWAAARREAYRRGALLALERLAAIHLADEDFAAAESYARRQLAIDPLHEAGNRQLIEILARGGRRSAALAHFDDYRRLLNVELGVKPGSETLALVSAVQGGELLPAARRPDHIRGYDIHEELGRGSYGVVFRASQPAIGRDVAVKVIPARYADDIAFIRRFEAEAQTIARLEHPQIVPLYDYWREPGSAYLVMRYLRGGNLRAALDGAPWPAERVARLLDQVAAALAVAHRHGVVHRDVKPANILLDEDGNAYLTDFGIARLLRPEGATALSREMFAGTPEYVSPEQALNEDVTPLSDQYSLGLVTYEALSGRPPFAAGSLLELLEKHAHEPVPPLREQRLDVPAAVDGILARALAKRPADRFPDVGAFAAAFRAAIAAGPAVGEAAAPLLDVANPYKGLLAFGEADAALFFGREALTQQLLARLAETGPHHRFLAVVGPSGSGKSSLVKAGLVPALRRGALPGTDKWFVLDMVPGAHPFEELETALLRVAVNPPASLLAQLQDGERGLLRAVRRTLPPDDGSELLLIIDQFEELFTLVPDRDVTACFLNALIAAVSDPRSPLRVIATLRADFYDRPLLYPGLSEVMQQRTEVVIPMTADELVQAIERPAARVGVGVEPELVAALVADVNEQPGALPLLQYTLSELFEERADGRLTLGAYRALGGISGALAQRADAVYDALDAPGQTAARALFSRLVTLGEGVEDTRRRVLRAEVEGLSVMDGRPPTADGETENENASGSRPSAVGGPLDAFGRARLLAFDRDPLTRGPTVEIAHEALLRAWPRLRGWLDEDRAALRLSRLLTAAAAEWKAAGGADGFLLRGARLDQLAPLAGGTVALTEGERGYLAVSLAAREARRAAEEARLQAELATAQKLAETERRRADEQAYSAGRLRRRAALLAGALGLAVILAVAALVLGRQANQSATLAQANAAAAQTAEAQALDQGATAEVERIRAEAGEADARAAEATAAAEVDVRATAEAIALQEQLKAEQQTLLATSRELAAAALNALSVDPELSLLLALQAFSTAHTYESENTLHRILPSLHLLRTFPPVGLSDRKLSPDGRYLANGAHDGLTVWDIPAALAGARDPVVLTVEIPIYEIAYSPDGTRITTFDADGIVRVLDALTGEVLSTLPGYSPELGNLNFSPDNTRLAIADLDGNLSVWDVQSGREIFTTSGHADVEAVGAPEPTGSIRQIKFSPDGSRLATAGNDGTARIWDADNGREIMTLTGHVTELNNLFFSYDGQRLATAGNDGTVKVWDLSQENLPGRLLLSLSHDEGVYGLGFSPDGTQLATGDRGGTITIWDTASGRKLLELAGHETTVYGPTFSPDGTRLITQSAEGVFKLWDVTHSRELFSLAGSPGPVGGPAFSPDGLYLATGHTDGNVLIWERATGQLRFTLPAHDGFVVDLAFSDDGTRLATASWDSTAKVWSVAEIVAGGTPEPVIMTGHADRVWRVGFTPDGSRLATGSVDETAKIWDVRSGELLATVTGLDEVGNGRIAALEISPDGKRLAIGAPDATVKIWDLTTTATTIDQPVLTIPIDTNFINDVAFSPDGSRLAVGHETSVIVWDISGTEGLVLFELLEHSGSTVAVDFSPDGRRLASASFDGTVKVWDMAGDGQELLTLSAHSDGVIGVAFSPDGKQLASASFDGTVQVYVLETSELIALAHDRLTRWWRLEECLAYLHTEACPPAPERFAANE